MDASRLREVQEKALEDPQFGFGLMNIPLNIPAFGTEMMTSGEVFVSQMIPYPEKLTLKGRMAGIMADIDYQMLLSKINEIKREIKMDYFQLFLVNRQIEVALKNKQIIKDFVKIAETKYIVNQGTQQDILRANVEQSKLTQKLIGLLQQKNNLKIRLAYYLGTPSAIINGEPGNIKLSKINYSLNQLEEITRVNQPEINMAEKNIYLRETENRMARLEYIPDFDFMLSYGFKPERADMISGRITINLPVWYKDKQNNRVKETENLIKANTEGLNSRKNEIVFTLRSLLNQIESQEKIYQLITIGTIPQAEQYLKSAISGYSVGKIDFQALLESLMTLLDYEIDASMSLAEHEKDIAELEFMTGRDLVKR